MILDPPYDGWAEWHKHFFAPDDESIGRYDAVEDRLGRIFVWNVTAQEVVQLCDTKEAACRIAKRLATRRTSSWT